MFLADQNKQSPDFLLKAQAIPLALLVPTLPELQYALTDQKSSIHIIKCTPASAPLQAQHSSVCAARHQVPQLFSLCMFYIHHPCITGQRFKKKKTKNFLIHTEEHKQLHLLLKGISLGLGRRTPAPPEERNLKLIQMRISLLVNILN